MELSSSLTFVYKVIFPCVWITVFGIGTASLFLGSPDSTTSENPAEMKWFFLLFFVAGCLLIAWMCLRLKRVRLDSDELFISNYRSEIRIPLREVAKVTENRWMNIHPVTIWLRAPTEFGDRIVFMPRVRWIGIWRSHPVVAQIREAVEGCGGHPAA